MQTVGRLTIVPGETPQERLQVEIPSHGIYHPFGIGNYKDHKSFFDALIRLGYPSICLFEFTSGCRFANYVPPPK